MSQTVKVGIFMTVALAILAYLIIKVEEIRLFTPEQTRVEVAFDSVAGLDDKAPVRVAGVPVGRVDGIRLEEGRAIVSLALDAPLELRQGATARITNLGILGDKFVQLDLGPAEAPPLPAGEILPGQSPVDFDAAIGKLSRIGDSIDRTLAAVQPEETGETINRLLENLERTSADIRLLVSANRDQVTSTIGNFERFSAALADELPRLTSQMERLLEQVEAVVAENREPMREGLSNLSDAADRIRSSIDNLNEISGRIAAGEGSLGKLVQSEEAHDQLVATMGSVETGVERLSEAFGRIEKLKLNLAMDGYYLDEVEDFRPSFGVTLVPGSERFYHLAVVDDPRGRVRSKTEVTTVTGPDGVSETTTVDLQSTEDKVTLSAQVGFNLRQDLRLRAGLFESTGGAGLDYGLFNRRFWLSLEAFDFGREPDLEPRLRLTGKWHLDSNFYLLGGIDDFLEGERDSLFLGAGIRWSDDDLKYLLGSLPTPSF